MNKIIIGGLVALSSLFSLTLPSKAARIQVTVTNLTNNNEDFSPVSSIFHDGSFDNFNLDEAASLGIERTAEDGDGSFLNADAISSGFVAGSVGTGPILTGMTVSRIFEVNPSLGRYFNFAAMFVPSNDAFIGNDDPTEYQIFDINGKFISQIIDVPASEIWDAGTEFNDETSPNAAIPGQPFTAGAGITENGVVTVHPGYIPGGNLEQLGFPSPTNLPSPVFRITITSVPEPSTLLGLLTVGGLSLLIKRQKQN
ncbi:PEP-CTERM sorting domain-containing protein [Crocosphaera sp. XPORK-15E]|uniref:PEP-CTERM sorting domain-containing protein n=1 Tax=Crocosphaera sp. XPORK-15E TaxID=3110247 RepID=UPI002B1FB83E|nr:PEP-CTERM sorting domain-containing protein [Crocosphaera sp. XPORK-15E]MEA5535835.1 PEP-CTERM sorting domain-containing protein [Crocosphaera sp. XPORK-15E]